MLQEFEIGVQIVDLPLTQLELGHGWVRGPNALGECLNKILDRIPLVERAERRRLR